MGDTERISQLESQLEQATSIIDTLRAELEEMRRVVDELKRAAGAANLAAIQQGATRSYGFTGLRSR